MTRKERREYLEKIEKVAMNEYPYSNPNPVQQKALKVMWFACLMAKELGLEPKDIYTRFIFDNFSISVGTKHTDNDYELLIGELEIQLQEMQKVRAGRD